MKKYITTLLLFSTLFIGEVHTFWEKGKQQKENWIINGYEPMTIQWNVKFLCEEINVILYFVSFWFFAKYPNRLNKVTVGMFIALSITDLVLYFWNFKTVNYHYVYFCMAGIWAFIYWWKSIKLRLFG